MLQRHIFGAYDRRRHTGSLGITVILLVEIIKRSFIELKKQEVYIIYACRISGKRRAYLWNGRSYITGQGI